MTQGFASWMGDWGKGLALFVISGMLLVWIFYWVVRRSPRRWWFYFWAVTVPITLFLMFIEPFVVEPLFYKFTPLDAMRPALVTQIEEMLHHAGLQIPRRRILEMDASSKTNTLNAYVSGLGASKRVVVWDTTLKKMTNDETLLVLGHETGHYVLHHIMKEFVLIELVALAFIAMGFIGVKKLIGRYGARTGLEGEGDLASLPVMLLVLTLLTFLSSPLVNSISRHYEHQADQFALEVTYGVVPNPNAAEAQAFQILGEQDLSDPDPSPFIVFWLYSHPPLAKRIEFALSYKPWAEGKPLQFVHAGKSH
jgi:STE24 endopeptidase